MIKLKATSFLKLTDAGILEKMICSMSDKVLWNHPRNAQFIKNYFPSVRILTRRVKWNANLKKKFDCGTGFSHYAIISRCRHPRLVNYWVWPRVWKWFNNINLFGISSPFTLLIKNAFNFLTEIVKKIWIIYRLDKIFSNIFVTNNLHNNWIKSGPESNKK